MKCVEKLIYYLKYLMKNKYIDILINKYEIIIYN